MPMRTKLEELLETVKTEYKVSKYLIEEAEEEYRALRRQIEIMVQQDLDAARADTSVEARLTVVTQRVRELEAGLRRIKEHAEKRYEVSYQYIVDALLAPQPTPLPSEKP